MNGLLTNIGAALIIKIVPLIRFHSRHKQIHTTVLSIFILSYMNMGLLVLKRYLNYSYNPPNLTPMWLLYYGKSITTSLVVSNMLPYIGPLFKIIYRRGCCCCRRKNYKPSTHLNPEFSMERKYASMITTVFICFTYGFAIPSLFIVASVVLLI